MLKWITVCLLIPMLAIGQVMDFDGGGEYVDIPDSFDSLGEGTLCAWVYLNSSAWQDLFMSSADFSGPPDDQLVFDVTGANKVRYQVHLPGDATVDLSYLSSTTLSLNTWYHVAVSVNSGGNRIYINGVRDVGSYTKGSASSTYFFDDLSATQETYLGRFLYEGTYYARLDAAVDDARIYDSALSSNQVYNLYQSIDPTNTPVLHMPFDYDDDQLPDISDNGNDGTAYNSPTIEAAR
jgi:hypothetical protein